ncbi:NO-inducible flavohemoprotein [Lysobacter sp. S4-A87]|uniref:NO-inducible flavohemoprotein n=1 Tax=Lysobacter sp. S4-A87 TaxID=2925843 RepID=UPI001F530758|nr:NO-inducible flavohemoprotein [Lysobacter sp. S4-A87]UNK50947.1 NO-inducible flavohemoprotein [Lysobacter sp. S4-A87]
MLTPEHRQIIKSTVPLLESGGEALTRHFYEILLGENPQLRPFFNQANQHSGDQPRALASGVLMYARHIDQLDQLAELVTLIGNKHVSLQIQAEHYPIVGACLLRAIREVLGPEVATDAVVDAWAAAYQQLAGILIDTEAGLYQATADRAGGWRGARRFTVVDKVVESDEITSFYFAASDGGAILAHSPGQFIGLRLDVDGTDQRRNYSLSAAANDSHYRISVKRVAGGAVSSHLHEQVQVGDEVDLFPPSGHFVLKPAEKPLVLISGGVGITPTLAMLQAALPSGRPIHFIHAARNSGVHAFRDWTDTLALDHPQLKRFYCYEEAGADPVDAVGYIDHALLERWMPATRDVDVYFLGPKPFMRAIKGHLKAMGVPERQCHYEFFGPATALD